jgi:hypothetical protein
MQSKALGKLNPISDAAMPAAVLLLNLMNGSPLPPGYQFMQRIRIPQFIPAQSSDLKFLFHPLLNDAQTGVSDQTCRGVS